MSITLPKNFVRLAGRDRAVVAALKGIAEFVNSHPQWEVIDSRLVARELSEIDAPSLARAIRILVDQGLLRQVYSVTTPSGSLTDEKFDRPSEIPPKLPDRFNEYFETAEQDVVPVLVVPKQ